MLKRHLPFQEFCLALQWYRCAALRAVLLLATSPLALAQLTSKLSELPQAPTSPTTSADVPEVPGLDAPERGWNAGLTITGVHDSTTGWATLADPAISYSFNDIFSVDATLPIYFYRLAESRSTQPRPDALLVNQRGELGDLILGLHAQFVPARFQYQLTGAVTAPTGDEAYGLTTGRVTFGISNLFQRTYGRFTPGLEIGGGNSTALVNRIVNKNYTSLGPLAHFQIGVATTLPFRSTFETDLYEQLPIGDQKIYSPSRNGKATIIKGNNVTEDNGFTNVLDIAIDSHTTLSGYYNRSLRRHTDTAAISITYVLRGAPPPEEESFDDLFH
jgi:hypothetical protein